MYALYCVLNPQNVFVLQLEVCTLWPTFLLFPHYLAPSNHYPTLWFYQFDCFWYLMLSGIIQYLSFCDWLILLSIMSSRFIHVVAYWRPSFLSFYSIPLCVYTIIILFICQWICRLFHILTIMNIAAINMDVLIHLWDSDFKVSE